MTSRTPQSLEHRVAELEAQNGRLMRLLGMAHLNLRQHLAYGFNPLTAKSTLVSVGQDAPELRQAIAEAEKQKPVAVKVDDASTGTIYVRFLVDECLIPVGTEFFTHPQPAQPKREPLTDDMVVAAARVLNKRAAEACNVDEADSWNLYGDEYMEDARAALAAAHGIEGGV